MTRRVNSPDEPLWDEPATVPSKAPQTRQERRFEPSLEDRSAAAAMSAAGLFRPMPKNSEALPHSRGPRSRWGKTVVEFLKRKPGEPLPGPEK